MTAFLGALAGFALSPLLGLAVRRALSWATDRAERDIYFCREYARPRGVTDSARGVRECAVCDGTGSLDLDDMPCGVCGGTGEVPL